MLIPNGTGERLGYIAKQYPKNPVLVFDMIDIIAHTVGADRWKADVTAASEADPAFRDDWRTANSLIAHAGHDANYHPQHATPARVLPTVLKLVEEMPQFRGRHLADGTFPWMAQQLAKLGKVASAAREANLRGDADAAYQWQRATGDYDDARNWLKRHGTAFARWAADEKPNLPQMSLVEATTLVREWEKNQTEGDVPQGEIVMKLADGWTAQKLVGAERLDAEGRVMQHCVGSYCRQVERGTSQIFSIRDKKGRPHATIELDASGNVKQVRGKQNEAVVEKYQKYVDEFLKNDEIVKPRPKKIQAIMDVIEAAQQDVEDEYLEDYAHGWANEGFDADDVKAWLDAGIWHNNPHIAAELAGEDVTVEEYVKWPYAIHYWIGEHDSVPEELVEIARGAERIQHGLSDRRREATRTFLPGPRPRSRYTGAGRQSLRRPIDWEETIRYASHSEPGDLEAILESEDWLAHGFSTNPDKDADFGPWYVTGMTATRAEEWWDAGVQSAEDALVLEVRRISPSQVTDLDDRAKKDAYTIIDTIEGVRPNRRRSSRRR